MNASLQPAVRCLLIGLFCVWPLAWSQADTTNSTATVSKSVSSPIRYGFGVSLGTRTTDKAYYSSTDAFDVIQDGLLTGYLEGKDWGMYYRGQWAVNFLNTELGQHGHTLSGEKLFKLPGLKGLLGVGATASIQDYSDTYSAYERLTTGAYLGLKLYPHKRWMLHFTGSAGYAYYYNTAAFSHMYHKWKAQATTWFPTKTTLRFSATFTHKYFAQDPTSLSSSSYINPDVDNSFNLKLYVRLAQSISNETAIRVWGAFQPNLNSEFRFSDTNSSSTDQNFADDLNAVYGGSAGVEFEYRPKWLRGFRAILFSKWAYNHYGGRKVYDSNGNAIEPITERQDHVLDTGLSLSYKLPWKKSGVWGNGLFLKAWYNFRYNYSNDANYTYPQHMFFLGLSTRQ